MSGQEWSSVDFPGSKVEPERTILDAAGFDILILLISGS